MSVAEQRQFNLTHNGSSATISYNGTRIASVSIDADTGLPVVWADEDTAWVTSLSDLPRTRSVVKFDDNTQLATSSPQQDTNPVDLARELLAESIQNNPDQNTSQKREESRRIAEVVFGNSDRKSIQRLAGVRAAMTKQNK